MVTAPLLQEPPPAPVFADPTPVPAAPEPPVLFVDDVAPVAERQATPADDQAFAMVRPAEPAASDAVPQVFVAPAAEPEVAGGRQSFMVPGLAIEAVSVPGWRAPDDPTLQVFRHELALREQRASGVASRGPRRPHRPRRRLRRRLRRMLVWLIGLALLIAALLMAPARLPLL